MVRWTDRYGAAHTPSFTASTSATAYFSVDGGVTNIVGFNQNQGLGLANYGDFGDFLSTTGCPDYVQDAFTRPNQQADETASSPEFQMMAAIGWDGASDPVPEPAPLALLGAAIGGLAFVLVPPGAPFGWYHRIVDRELRHCTCHCALTAARRWPSRLDETGAASEPKRL